MVVGYRCFETILLGLLVPSRWYWWLYTVVTNQLPICTAYQPKRAKTSTTDTICSAVLSK